MKSNPHELYIWKGCFVWLSWKYSISILANSRSIVAKVFQIVLKPPVEVQSYVLNFGPSKMFLKLSLARHHSKRALNQTLFIVFFPLFIFNQSSLLIFAQNVLHFCLNWDISAFCSEELRQPLWSPQKSSSHRFLVNAIVIQECLLLCLLCLFWTEDISFFTK